ncbi:MAG: hypothetical protein ABI867_28380 [Kofleriaceae bacterium]
MSMRYSLLALLTLAACDPQVDSDHQGTPLATISGSVRNARTAQPDDAEVVVVWINTAGSPDLAVAESANVEGSFPAQFTLDMYEPPVDAVVNEFNGVRFAFAYIIAGVPGTDYTSDEAAEGGILGMEENHLLLYMPEAVPAGSDVSYLLHDAPAAGFHIYAVTRVTDEQREARRTCIDGLADPTFAEIYTLCGGEPRNDFTPLATDLSTSLDITLVDSFDQIDPPDVD